MKKKLLQIGFGAFVLIFMMFSTATAANLQPDNWTKSGQGTTQITTTADGAINFYYHLQSDSIFQGQWWHFESTAESTENFEFNWHYNAFHSWYQATARAYAYADGPNGRQTVTLYNGYGQIDTSGITSLTLTQGYNYGFSIYGYNYDGTRIATGNLTISGLDEVAPTTILSTDPTDALWNNSDIQVSLNASDNGSGVENTFYTINGGTQQSGTSFAITTEGPNTISYWSVDKAGNVEAVKTETINIDKSVPITTANVSENWQTEDVFVTLSASDIHSGIAATYYQVNGGEVLSGNTVQLTQDGTHTLTYWSLDKAGNIEEKQTKEIKIDKTAPNTTDNAPSTWQSGDVVVTLSATDTGSGLDDTHYQVNGGEVKSGNTVQFTQEGTHTLTYWSVDKVGNIEAEHSKTILIDKTAPNTTDNSPSTWQSGNVVVTLNASDTYSGLEATYYQINGGEAHSGNTIQFTQEGTYTLTYWSVDKVGNIEAKHSKTIKIDKTAPKLQVTLDKTSLWSPNHKLIQINAFINTDDSMSDLESVVLTSITSNEPDAGLDDEDLANDIQGAAYGTLDTSFLVRAERAGYGSGRVYTITYTATDKAGNQTQYVVTVEVPHNQGKKGKN